MHPASSLLVPDHGRLSRWSWRRFCDQPTEAKMALPRVNWGEDKILGYEINHVSGELALQLTLHAHAGQLHDGLF